MNRIAYRYSLPVLMLAFSSGVFAVGLGDLRGQPVLGQQIQFDIDLLGAEKQKLDASCFRLVQPSGSSDLPWLKKAVLGVRKDLPPVLEVRSDVLLREPIMQVAIQLGCGHEVSREYILMGSPLEGRPLPVIETRQREVVASPEKQAIQRPVRVRSVLPAISDEPSRLPTRRVEKRPVTRGMPDRLMLSDDGEGAEPSLRLSTGLFLAGAEIKEAQREILRLEFRMLMAMNEQATSQMATAEKLRNMEGTLGELQQRAAEFAKRVETEGAVPIPGSSSPDASGPNAPLRSAAAPSPGGAPSKRPPVVEDESYGVSEWALYGVLLGAVLGLAAWLGWKNYRERILGASDLESPVAIPEVKVDPKRAEEREEPGGVDLPFEPVAMGMPMQVDVELDTGSGESHSGRSEMPAKPPERGHDSLMSISATTLDEHFEANPVMELADIMLSFGRVKGAAQALQEYIDHNPQEALQPWIRLMDVYRMAGMRTEFESVARNLNMHFNVEVQSWDDALSKVGVSGGHPVAPRPQTLEDLPRLVNTIVDLWDSGDVVGYMYQLLRDNRGGQRLGFSLPVVEDVLFLIELKETANRMERV